MYVMIKNFLDTKTRHKTFPQGAPLPPLAARCTHSSPACAAPAATAAVLSLAHTLSTNMLRSSAPRSRLSSSAAFSFAMSVRLELRMTCSEERRNGSLQADATCARVACMLCCADMLEERGVMTPPSPPPRSTPINPAVSAAAACAASASAPAAAFCGCPACAALMARSLCICLYSPLKLPEITEMGTEASTMPTKYVMMATTRPGQVTG